MKIGNRIRIASFGPSVFLLCAPFATYGQSAVGDTRAIQTGAQAPASAEQKAAQPLASHRATETITQPVAPADPDFANDIFVTVGKAIVLDLAQPITRILIGFGDFAEAVPVNPTQVVINGKAPGETTMILWDKRGGRQFFNITVRSSALEAVRRQLWAELPGQHLNVTMEGPNVYLRGTVNELNSSNRAALIAGTMGKVINLLNVKIPAAAPQILLKVRFASVDRSKEKQLGFNLFSTNGKAIGAISTGEYSAPSVTTTGSASVTNDLNLFVYDPGLNIGATIQALEERGLAESLAEPNILAENGKPASFLAGGEYPYPMVQPAATGASSVTIAFKEFGIRLNFTPTITPRGTIRLQVAPEVSALDYGDAVTISGSTEPAISVRRVKTEIELEDRQSFAIGGLLDNTLNETFEKVPFIGDIPVLGKLFQSMTRTKANTELIVIVTPEIVRPVPAGTLIPTPSYPQAFLSSNSKSAMNTPDAKDAAESPSLLGPGTIPVEELIESLNSNPQQTDGGGSGTSVLSSATSGPPQR